jgi:hypothetical protein
LNYAYLNQLQEIQKDVLALQPSDEDISGIEILIQQSLKYFNLDVKELAKFLVGQNYVTTVIKVSSKRVAMINYLFFTIYEITFQASYLFGSDLNFCGT